MCARSPSLHFQTLRHTVTRQGIERMYISACAACSSQVAQVLMRTLEEGVAAASKVRGGMACRP